MLNRFLNKAAPIIGRYFRSVGLIVLGLAFFSLAWFSFSEVVIKGFGGELFKTLESIWFVLPILFFVMAGAISFWWLFRKDKEREYEGWGIAFYLLIIFAVIYFLLKPSWPEDVFDYLNV